MTETNANFKNEISFLEGFAYQKGPGTGPASQDGSGWANTGLYGSIWAYMAQYEPTCALMVVFCPPIRLSPRQTGYRRATARGMQDESNCDLYNYMRME